MLGSDSGYRRGGFVSVGSDQRKLIFKNDTNGVYVSPGYLLFAQNGALMAQRFDVEYLELKGPIAVGEAVPVFAGQQHALFSASDNGLLAIHSKLEMLAQPVWVDASGKVLEPLTEPAMFAFGSMHVSPGGRKVALGIVDTSDGADNIVPFPDAQVKVQVSKGRGSGPHWTHDGRQLLYIGKDGVLTALHYGASGIEVGEIRQLFELDIPEFDISADGKRFLTFKIVENQEPSTVTLISNWLNALPK